MSVIYLSHILDVETPGFGGAQGFFIQQVRRIANGDSCNQSEWRLSNHIGTHIDAPLHFSDIGQTVSAAEAAQWIFTQVAIVEISVNPGELIAPGDWIAKVAGNTELLLLRTGFEKFRSEELYWSSNPGLSTELANELRARLPKLRAIGVDFISATSFLHRKAGREAHQAFLDPARTGNPIWIIEDMSLKNLKSKPFQVTVAPVRVRDADGAPVTVFAFLNHSDELLVEEEL